MKNLTQTYSRLMTDDGYSTGKWWITLITYGVLAGIVGWWSMGYSLCPSTASPRHSQNRSSAVPGVPMKITKNQPFIQLFILGGRWWVAV